ncbi:MAG: hypothetical protein KF878_18480 [Planctomycetes bacterium]|nr:hypothetical protein [Planctomycetota bacterium]
MTAPPDPPSPPRRSTDLAFGLATREDEPRLRQLLRAAPMEGDIRLAMEREPDFFLGLTIEGDVSQVLVCRDRPTGAVISMGTRSVRDGFLDGAPARVGYLGQLRTDPAHRGGKAILVRGYADLRRAHDEDPRRPALYTTAIFEGNAPARRILERGLKGLPTYALRGRFVSLVYPPGRRRGRPPAGVTVRQGDPGLLEPVAACLQRSARRYQFAPCWTAADLASPERARGLRPEDFVVALRGGEVVGCAAVWDQRAYKQTRVTGYSRRMAWARPVANLLAPLLGTPRLPRAGAALRDAFLSHLAVDDDDPAVARALLAAALRGARGKHDLVTLALDPTGPLFEVARAFPHRPYPSVLYAVHWEDGAAAVAALDDRPAWIEAALL